jgi:hypothetical protein
MALADNNRESGFNTLAVVLGGLAGIFLVIALALFIEGGYKTLLERERQAKIMDAGPSEEVIAHQAEQRALLEEKAHYLDREAGVLSMPIEDAMERVVSQNAK